MMRAGTMTSLRRNRYLIDWSISSWKGTITRASSTPYLSYMSSPLIFEDATYSTFRTTSEGDIIEIKYRGLFNFYSLRTPTRPSFAFGDGHMHMLVDSDKRWGNHNTLPCYVKISRHNINDISNKRIKENSRNPINGRCEPFMVIPFWIVLMGQKVEIENERTIW